MMHFNLQDLLDAQGMGAETMGDFLYYEQEADLDRIDRYGDLGCLSHAFYLVERAKQLRSYTCVNSAVAGNSSLDLALEAVGL